MARPTTPASNIALLAPVPLVHLIDGQATAQKQGKVAFGSRAWELFVQLDRERKGMPVDVYIYASHSDDPRALVTWRARYVRKVESNLGAHPDGMRYRPPSTASHPADNQGYWGLFWEVEDLHPLTEGGRIPLSELTGFGKKRSYGRPFVPEGPMLIEHP